MDRESRGIGDHPDGDCTFLGQGLWGDLDLDPLMEKAEEIRVKMRDVMRSTQKVMKDAGKEQEYELPSMYV